MNKESYHARQKIVPTVIFMTRKNFAVSSSRSALGAAIAIALGKTADMLGAVGFVPAEALVRWISGNADTLGELVAVKRRKLRGKTHCIAENYVRGELIGSVTGFIVITLFHTVGTQYGINPYGLGIIIAASFAHSDNIGGMIANWHR